MKLSWLLIQMPSVFFILSLVDWLRFLTLFASCWPFGAINSPIRNVIITISNPVFRQTKIIFVKDTPPVLIALSSLVLESLLSPIKLPIKVAIGKTSYIF